MTNKIQMLMTLEYSLDIIGYMRKNLNELPLNLLRIFISTADPFRTFRSIEIRRLKNLLKI